ncbi:phosphoenolpyruvate carboxylase [Candidatus Micrarchaeota archaeon]|nr:phosphoenolpyruvate carboxylase [Candidatus Micrarchaeota archaeon]
MVNRKIPRCMSTQHPDNASTPFFSNSSVIEGEAEVKEAYFVYSHLNCEEQMWDSEGKDVDNFVVRKLLSEYPRFFSEKVLGKDVFLTLRVPNPDIEKNEGKILLEALESIPRSFDSAKTFYGPRLDDGTAPVFEVIIPMTTDPAQVNRVWSYYKNFVVGKGSKSIVEGDISVSEWVGGFNPQQINVIPLIENQESMERIDFIVGGFLKGKNIERQRVFLARSDPALNYGSLPAVLLVKNALQKLAVLEEKQSVELLPIIGTGSAPFRGNLKPSTVEDFVREYPSIQTFTVQSAFKYDYPPEEVRKSIDFLLETKRGKPLPVDEEKSGGIITRVSAEYASQVQELAPFINKISAFVPKRRKRHLHIGLFGYSRSVTGISLPRAISFCASLYSIGIPPELLGLSVLKPKDFEYLDGAYKSFRQDIADAARFFNPETLEHFPSLKSRIAGVLENFEFEVDQEHLHASSQIMSDFSKNHTGRVTEEIEKAAWIRKFLG